MTNHVTEVLWHENGCYAIHNVGRPALEDVLEVYGSPEKAEARLLDHALQTDVDHDPLHMMTPGSRQAFSRAI